MNQPFNTNGGIHEIPLPSGTGRLWLCGKHYIGPNVEEVLAGCDNAIAVCLVQEHELSDRYPSYVEWHETHAGTRGIWNPIDDLSYPEFDEIFEILDELNDEKLTGVFHCFTGDASQAEKVISYNGFKMGIGGVLTYKKAGLDETLKGVPLEYLI